MKVIWPDFGRISASKTDPKIDGKRDGHFYVFLMDLRVDLGAKMASKIESKIYKNLIVFGVVLGGGGPIPSWEVPAGPGRRGGVGEGIYMYI